MSITLPPLSSYVRARLASAGLLTEVITRDLEVAKVVLEAAAMEADFFNQHDKSGVFIANAIRNLKVSHAE